MLTAGYEILFVRADGRKLLGPIFRASELTTKRTEIKNSLDKNPTRLWSTFGNRCYLIPQKTLETGHLTIRPIGWIYYFVRKMRSK